MPLIHHLLVVALSLPAFSRADIEFTAYLHADGTDYFQLTDRDARTKSEWLTLGRSFRDRRLVSYDAARAALLVESAGQRETLLLRDAATREGSSGLQVLKTEFGWFAAKERGRGTTDVPLEPGITFGIEITLAGAPPKATMEFETRIFTPPLTQPDGTLTTLRTSRQKISANAEGKVPTRTAYFTFDQPWQLVPGTYRTELVHEGRVIASKDFNVSRNAPRPADETRSFLKAER